MANHLDDIRDAESDFLSCFDENAVLSVGTQGGFVPKATPPPETNRELKGSGKKGSGKKSVKEEASPSVAVSVKRQQSFLAKHELNGYKDEAHKLTSLIKQIWGMQELIDLNQNEKELLGIVDGLQSSEKEQLFMSGGNFVGALPVPELWQYDNEETYQVAKQAYDPEARRHDITRLMKDTYQLTQRDYCNSRSWTRDFSESTVKVDDRTLTFRDVGGDELNRTMHWDTAIKDSFCTLFLISLSDFTKKDKLKNVRHILWTYLITEERPKIIMLLNKKDLFFKKLRLAPLHTACSEFRDVAPQGGEESFPEYSKRCQKAIINFFNDMPKSVKATPLYQERRKDACFDPHAVKLSAAYITQATDSLLFANVKDELLGVFSEQLKEMLSDAF
jgi:hypothetical protein